MGKIKTRLVKRTGEELAKKERAIDFSENFNENKKILGNTMPSKKIRNQIAGYLARLKRKEKAKDAEMEKAQKKR